jgi:hypothetical protein
MNLQTYLRHRRPFEIALWALFFIIQFSANVAVVLFDINRVALDFEPWQVMVWEGSSIAMQALLLPVILGFDRRFPLELGHLGRGLPAHALFTVPFSLAHVLGMVGLRHLAYRWAGGQYDFGHWPTELFYEYLKDFRAYAGYIALIYLYRFVLRRLQGEARFLAEEAAEERSPPQPVTDRFLVKKLGREFLVKVDDIDWIEAAGNYVNLHVGQRLYPLRETMAGIEQRLQGAGFERVHRSAIVNLDRVAEIVPFDTGDAEARLNSGAKVSVSRRYRAQLRERLESPH